MSGDDELVSYVHMESLETAEDERLTIAEELDNQDDIHSADPQQEILLVIEESDFQSFKVSHRRPNHNLECHLSGEIYAFFPRACATGLALKKPTQKNPPKKTPKNPTKNGFFGSFSMLNFL